MIYEIFMILMVLAGAGAYFWYTKKDVIKDFFDDKEELVKVKAMLEGEYAMRQRAEKLIQKLKDENLQSLEKIDKLLKKREEVYDKKKVTALVKENLELKEALKDTTAHERLSSLVVKVDKRNLELARINRALVAKEIKLRIEELPFHAVKHILKENHEDK